ncbi:MAG TPA: metallophosphoesterase family protein [Candidatus Dormibacteraeota bacterium]
MRVGVIADTHFAEFLDELPEAVFERLNGCQLILHAGDVGRPEALERLRGIAPVEAVRGDHDPALQQLPLERELEIAGRRVALIHGNRSRLLEEPITFVGTITLGYIWPQPGLHRWLRARFPRADAIVYGHTHHAAVDRREGRLVFNPGAVYQTDRAAADRRLRRKPGWFEWSWLQVIRHRRRVAQPSVGILEFGPDGIRAEVLPLS